MRIAEIEADVASAMQKRYARELAAVDAPLERIVRGLNDFEDSPHQEQGIEDPLTGTRLFLAIRSFNSLRIAARVVDSGNYQQALTLVRMAMESRLVATDGECHPPTLRALWDPERRLPPFADMAKRLSPKAKEVWSADYGWISESAAHPRFESMRGLVTVGPDGRKLLEMSGRFDEVEPANVLYYLMRELVQLMGQVARLNLGAGTDWSTGTIPLAEELGSLSRKLEKWASDQVDGATERPR